MAPPPSAAQQLLDRRHGLHAVVPAQRPLCAGEAEALVLILLELFLSRHCFHSTLQAATCCPVLLYYMLPLSYNLFIFKSQVSHMVKLEDELEELQDEVRAVASVARTWAHTTHAVPTRRLHAAIAYSRHLRSRALAFPFQTHWRCLLPPTPVPGV